MRFFAINIIFLNILFIFLPVSISAENGNDTLYLDKKFFWKFSGTPLIEKDNFLEERMNRIVRGRAVIKSIDRVDRYRKQFRIELVDKAAERYKLTIKYYIFFDSEEYEKMLVEGEIIEFKGQFMAYTPVNNYRNSYIIDIVLEEGAIVIE